MDEPEERPRYRRERDGRRDSPPSRRYSRHSSGHREREFSVGSGSGDGKSVYVGNLDMRSVNVTELKKMFEEKGPVSRVDLKEGFAFVFMESGHEDAIRDLDGKEIGIKPIRVQWARGDGRVKKREEERQSNLEPSETLFVVNFDPYRTMEEDLREAFEKYGPVIKVDLKKNYAFIEFERLEDAVEAKEKMDLTKFGDRQISVQYKDSKGPKYSRRYDVHPDYFLYDVPRGRSRMEDRYRPKEYFYRRSRSPSPRDARPYRSRGFDRREERYHPYAPPPRDYSPHRDRYSRYSPPPYYYYDYDYHYRREDPRYEDRYREDRYRDRDFREPREPREPRDLAPRDVRVPREPRYRDRDFPEDRFPEERYRPRDRDERDLYRYPVEERRYDERRYEDKSSRGSYKHR